MEKLNEIEKIIIENIDKKYKWIARDKDNQLSLFKTQPCKIQAGNCGSWKSTTGRVPFSGYNHLLKFITWDDDVPCEIKKILKN